MSGGSHDYIHFKINEFANEILHFVPNDPKRIAFSKLLKLISKAAHDIEWVDSCDYGKGDEHKSIDGVFAFLEADPIVLQKAKAYDGLKTLINGYLTLGEAEKKVVRGSINQV